MLATIFLLTVTAHLLVWRMNYWSRPYVFGAVAIVLLVWPVLCYFAPKNWLLPMLVVPLFGISLGMFYTGDMGSDDDIFAA